ncbi:MAG TPA: glycosyltransferase [Mycobacteriales bacterium]|nr:glycosyltransferase [Mycobacteriales bacterium]
MPAPAVAVCVSTRNRAALLRRLLDELERQTLATDAFEVVVVDDGSTDETPKVLDEAAGRGVLRLRALRHPISRGPAAGRNAAWRAASAPVIAFTDDDCVPAERWLERGLATMGAQQRVVVGRVDPNPEQSDNAGPFAHTWVIRSAQARSFATANVLFRRDDLLALDGFDERYRNPACEDTDLGLRAEEAGAAVVFAPDALVWHDIRPGTWRDKVRDQARWADLALVFRTHPAARRDLLHRGVFWKPSHVDLLLLLAGTVVAARDVRGLVLALPWLHRRLCRETDGEPWPLLLPSLPGLLAVDVAELTAMVRGSIRYRTLVL